MRKPTVWVPTRSDTSRAVQSQKIARSLKFWMKEEEGLYYPCRENKGADHFVGFLMQRLKLHYSNCIISTRKVWSSYCDNNVMIL